ncbi:MAG TPA: hypothetical protein VFS21_18725 [Roseiflexaceae bacterium]|nr:hypothetical protein [Roseiflexaceae bacterium]
MSEQQKDVSGTLFRGADGNLYFIPDTYLPAFRVFKSARGKVEGLLKGGRNATTLSSEAEDTATTPDTTATPDASLNTASDADKQRPNARLDAVHATIPIPVPDSKTVATTQAGIISASVQSEIE